MAAADLASPNVQEFEGDPDLGGAAGSSGSLGNMDGPGEAPSESSALAMEVVDFLEGYLNMCRLSHVTAVPSLKKSMQEAIDEGRIPDSLSLSGTQDDLRHRRLDDAHVEALSVPLGGVSFLKSIDLSFNEISDAGAARIASFLKSNRHVHTLNLSSNNIKSAGAKALADVLIHDESVANLNLAHNELGTDGGIAIANMLQVNTALHTLNLTSTSQTATSLTALFIVLLNHPTLRDIDVSDNASQTHRLTQTLDRDVMLHVARAMRSEENALETLGIGKMGITDWICVEVIAGAVKSSLGLQVLNLRANRISRDGGVALSQALYKHPHLRVLNLSCCNIQDEGAEAIAMMLCHNKAIKELRLDHNGISGKGLRDIAQSLATRNTTLTSIYLWGNKWDTPACECFAPLLGGPYTKIEHNQLTIDDSRTRVTHNAKQHQPRHSQPRGPAALPSRIHPNDTDVVFYAVEGVVHVGQNVLL